jgi:PAS domain S-box-containing protein
VGTLHRHDWVWVTVAIVVYVVVYFLIAPYTGLPGAAAAPLAIFVGWVLKTRRAAIVGVFVVILTFILSLINNKGDWRATLSPWLGYIVIYALAFGAGYVRSYIDRARDQTRALVEAQSSLLEVNSQLQRERDQLKLQTAALDAAANAIIITDRQGIITWINPAFTRLTGYSFQEAVGQSTRLLKSNQHDPSYYQTMWATILAGRVWEGETINRRKDGLLYTEEQSITPVRNAAGEITHFISFKHDITTRKQIEDSRHRQSEYLSSLHQISLDLLNRQEVNTLLQTIVERAATLISAAHGFIFLPEDDSLVLRAATKGFARNLGSREPKPGKGVLGRVWESCQTVVIENYDKWALHDSNYVAQGLRAVAGTPIVINNSIAGVLEVARVEEDGRVFSPEETGILIRFAQMASLVLDNAQLYAEAQREIQARKRTEELLVQSEARFRQIVESASDIIYRTDVEGHFTYVNPPALHIMGFASLSDILGKHYLDLVAPVSRHKLQRRLQHQLLSRIPNMYVEFIAITAKGEQIWLGQNVQIVKEGETITGFQAVARNITDLKRTEEALAVARDQALSASRFKSQLLAKVSHDLRTPLSGIIGYAELLGDGVFGTVNEEQKEAAKQIMVSSDFLSTMVNELLDQAQIESKSLILHLDYFSPLSMLQQIEAALASVAHFKGLALSSAIRSEVPQTLWGDRQRLQQIILNLGGNAIKFTKAGEIRIEIFCPTTSHWAIRVTDTGAGIPPEAQAFIFEPFRQVDNAITRENRGTGLGLSITKHLVELMGGRIDLDSEVGRGSIFTVILPLITQPPKQN